MAKRKLSITRFDVDPYDVTLYLVTNKRDYLKLRSRYTEEPLDLKHTGGCSSDYLSGGIQLVGVFNGAASTLVHELGHMVIKVMESRGVPITSECSEAFCYLQHHLFEKCWRVVEKGHGKA